MKGLIVYLYLFFTVSAILSQEYIAAVQKESKWGFIDEKGSWIIEPEFDNAGNFSEGYAIVTIDGTKYYTDIKGDIYGKTEEYEIFHNFSDGLARVRVDGKWGYIDTSFSIVIKPIYEGAKDFSEGYASVKVINRWHYINQNNIDVFNKSFKKAYDFHEGMAMVKSDGWCFIDTSGVIHRETADVHIKKGFSEGFAIIEKNKSYGFIDKQLVLSIPAKYMTVKPFSEGIASVRVGLKWGYINTKGEWLAEPDFEKAYEFHSGVAMVRIEGKWHFYNKDFVEISDVNKYAVIFPFSNGLARVRSGKFWGYIDTIGEFVVEPGFTSARNFIKITP